MSVTNPGNTIRLNAVARNPYGDSLPHHGDVQYVAADSAVTVDTNGLVTARYETISRQQPTYIIASLQDTLQRITRLDTVFIQVTPTAPVSPLSVLSIQPSSTDSLKRAANLGVLVTLTPTLTTSDGTPASSDILVAFRSSDETVATITSRTVDNILNAGGAVTASHAGKVTFSATAWAYGVARRDTVAFTFTLPSKTSIQILSKTPTENIKPVLYFWPSIITVGVGGIVTWQNNLTDSIDVTFDDPTHVDSARARGLAAFPYTGRGSFTGLYYDTVAYNNSDFDTFFLHNLRARTFQVAGTYRYHSTLYGTQGEIVVQ